MAPSQMYVGTPSFALMQGHTIGGLTRGTREINQKCSELEMTVPANSAELWRLIWQQPVHVRFTGNHRRACRASGVIAACPDIHLAIPNRWHSKLYRISGGVPGSPRAVPKLC